MKKVKVGKSDVEVTPVAFGAWAIGGWMWGGNDDKEAIRAIHASLDRGITTLDTAPIYGFGHSEKLVAEALKGKSRDKVEILSKFGLRWDTTAGVFYFDSHYSDGTPVKIYKYAGKEGIRKEVEDSLRRLQTDYIDLYQLHWPDSSTAISETMEAMDELKKEGKIRAIGVCNYTAAQMEEAEKTTALASNQVPYSMVKRDIEKDVIPYALAHQNGILAYSPLQRGLLTGKITSDFVFQSGDHRPATTYFKEPNRTNINQMLDQLRPLAADKACTLSQLVLRWTLEQPAISCVLAGARNAQQVEDNARCMDVSISQEEMTFIYQLLSQLVIV